MSNKKEIIAGIIIIGNEVLSATKDINTSTLLQGQSLGVKVKEVKIIPDDEQTIINTVNQYRKLMIMYSLLVELVQHMMTLRKRSIFKYRVWFS